MEQHLAAAAERHAGGRADHRKGRVFEREEDVLAFLHVLLEQRPHGGVGGEQGEADIGADREVVGIVADHQRPIALFVDLRGLAHHRHARRIEGVHL